MTPQGGDHGDQESSASFRLVLRALDRVEANLTMVLTKFEGLSALYMPREELNTHLSNVRDQTTSLTERVTALEARREADRQHGADQLDKVEDRRRADRNAGLMILIGIAGVCVTLLAIVIAHWK